MIFLVLLLFVSLSLCQRGMGNGRGNGRGKGNGRGMGKGLGKRMGPGGGMGGGGGQDCSCMFCEDGMKRKNEEGANIDQVSIDLISECEMKFCKLESCKSMCQEKVVEMLAKDSCADYCQAKSGKGCGICKTMIQNLGEADTWIKEECSWNEQRPKCEKMKKIKAMLEVEKNCLSVCL